MSPTLYLCSLFISVPVVIIRECTSESRQSVWFGVKQGIPVAVTSVVPSSEERAILVQEVEQSQLDGGGTVQHRQTRAMFCMRW